MRKLQRNMKPFSGEKRGTAIFSRNMPSTKKIWIIAGEASGDTYGAALARQLKTLIPNINIRGMGGNDLREAGADLIVDSSDLGVVGVAEVVKHLPTFVKTFRRLVNEAIHDKPDAVVLIDYPGFNLRFAEKMHRNGIPVIYYVSPQVWAWGRRRIPKMARIIDKMLVLFPFELEVFKDTGLDVEFVGHPLVELLAPYQFEPQERDKNLILLLPGSRLNEVKRLLLPMLETAAVIKKRNPEKRFILPAPGPRLYNFIKDFFAKHTERNNWPEVEVVRDTARQWMGRADAGLAASGTVTIEAAILGLPLVVVYRLHWLTYHFARILVKIPYFTMVNLVTKEEIFQEFLQRDVRPEILTPAVEAICTGGTRRLQVEQGMKRAVDTLGGQTDICLTTARKVLQAARLTENGRPQPDFRRNSG